MDKRRLVTRRQLKKVITLKRAMSKDRRFLRKIGDTVVSYLPR